MSYNRQNLVGQSLEELKEYTLKELEALERSFRLHEFVTLKKRYAAPERLYDGLIVYADGTTWDPGSGEGIYAYYGAGWNKLG